ncbi:GNAT family N-acetyltransferase [Marinobacter sp. TBZ242]|uniref:GNAT family N-acetyltransferase n=1 Tax=Marinobacter azerbaijanicus TaxID=3050455 RepID=A0ABT7IC69_9GAMM|nr:GNAT family N-acetyltransferase [Marinobacter sp. TBZ242]MDL0431750.1 GNAT family N-acetyltransferase [Marinobacter sp. TBZ242]
MIIAEAPRLLLREFSSDDVGPLAEILGDPRVMEFSTNGPCTEDDTRQFIDWCQGSYRDHGFGQWAVVERLSRAVIGFCGLSHVELDGAQEIEIGYRLAPSVWGQGLASEAAEAALEYGFSHCHIDSIIAIIATRHVVSACVAEKVGFKIDTHTKYRGWNVRIYRKHRTANAGAA